MKRFAVVLCSMDEDVKIKFFNGEDWRVATLQAAEEQSEEFPLWNCLDVPDEAMTESESNEGEDSDDDNPEPLMVPLDLHEAMQDATNSDMIFAVVEVPTA